MSMSQELINLCVFVFVYMATYINYQIFRTLILRTFKFRTKFKRNIYKIIDLLFITFRAKNSLAYNKLVYGAHSLTVGSYRQL